LGGADGQKNGEKKKIERKTKKRGSREYTPKTRGASLEKKGGSWEKKESTWTLNVFF